jgi:DNA replication licensing factor MCM6
LEDDDPQAQEEDQPAGATKRRRPRNQGNDVPLVKDAVGESVVDAFEKFVRT